MKITVPHFHVFAYISIFSSSAQDDGCTRHNDNQKCNNKHKKRLLPSILSHQQHPPGQGKFFLWVKSQNSITLNVQILLWGLLSFSSWNIVGVYEWISSRLTSIIHATLTCILALTWNVWLQQQPNLYLLNCQHSQQFSWPYFVKSVHVLLSLKHDLSSSYN